MEWWWGGVALDTPHIYQFLIYTADGAWQPKKKKRKAKKNNLKHAQAHSLYLHSQKKKTFINKLAAFTYNGPSGDLTDHLESGSVER